MAPLPDDYHQHPELSTRHRFEPMPAHASAYIRDMIPPNLEDEQAAYFTLANLYEDKGGILAAASGGVMAFGSLVQGSDGLVKELSLVHEQYYNKKMKRAEFIQRKQQLLKDINHKVGPFRNDLFNGNLGNNIDLPRKAGKRRGLKVSHEIDMHASKLSRLSRYAKNGGVVLAVAGAGLACVDIANTDDQQEKNEILVETTTSTLVGTLGGTALSLVLLSNPLGWGVALVLSAGVATTAWAVGKYSREVYTNAEEKIDFASISRVDKLCKM